MKIYELLLEKAPPQMATFANLIVKYVLDNNPNVEEMRANRGSKYDESGFYQIRIKPKSKDISFESIIDDLEKSLKTAEAKKVLKLSKVTKNDVSPNSGKFSSVSFNIGTAQYDIVVAAGGNKGEHFEKDLLQKLQQAHADDDIKSSKDAEDALTALQSVDKDIRLANIKSIEPRKGTTKRSVDTTPKEAGEIIADIIITCKKGGKKFISVKNSDGSTIANFGVAKAFNDDLTVNTNAVEWKKWLQPLGLDADKISEGLKAYAAKKTQLSFDDVENLNRKISKTSPVYKLLHQLWGSDYIYLRHKGKKFEAELVDDDYIHEHLLKNLTINQIRYPSASRKQVTIILTSAGKKYKLELRNSKGAIKPMELKFGLAS